MAIRNFTDKLVPNLASWDVLGDFIDKWHVLVGFVPELRALDATREINGWHYGESTKEHTLQVIKNVLNLLRQSRFSWLRDHLTSQSIDGRSLLDLFLWANLLHDIAKPYTQEVVLTRVPDMVLYPGHEEMGAKMTQEILDRLGFNPDQIAWVSYIVRWHGDMHGFFGKGDEEFSARRGEWEKVHGPHLVHLYLHSLADTIGSRLEEWNPTQYDLRLARYGQLIAGLYN